MADLSHSLPRAPVSATLSKKVSNGNGFATKNVYDDVFGGPPKFGIPTFSSRIDDYSEIFGGYHASRGSTIPILDLPDVDESNFLVDVRSSKFDYSEVFGGFEVVDFAVPYEELFAEPEGRESSSEDVWTPAETGSPSEGSSEDPACSENIQTFSNGKSHHSYESVKKINTFYHKSNQMSKEDGMSGTTHVTKLNAIPAFTLLVDEEIPTQKEKYAKSLDQVANDCNLNVDARIGLTEETYLRNINSQAAAHETVLRTSENNPKPQRNLNGNETHSEREFLTVSEINLRTQPSHIPPPSRPPPRLTIKQGESNRVIASNLKISRSYTFEGAAKDSSPTFFDVEVDASSSAAASAAAMKEAMEKAQATLKSAKLSMERKREGFQSRKMLGLKDDLRVKEKTESETAHQACRFKEEKSHRKFENEDDETKDFDRDERKQAWATQFDLAFEGRMSLPNVFKESLHQMPAKERRSNHEPHKQDEAGKQKAENQFSELARTDKLKTAAGLPGQEKSGTKLMLGAEVHESEQNEKQAAKMVFEQQEEKKRKLQPANEASEREEHEKKIEVEKEVHQGEESGKKVHAAQNANVQEENERISKVSHEQVNNDKKLSEARECQKYASKANGVCELKEPGKILKEVAYGQEEHEKKQKQAGEQKKNGNEHIEACQREDNEKSQRYANEREGNGKRVKEAHEQEQNERMLKEIPGLEEIERRQKQAHGREEDQRSLKEALGQEEHDKRAKKTREQEENEKQQKEAYGKEESLNKLEELKEEEEKERMKVVCEKEETEKQQKEACEEENEKKQKEAPKGEEKEKKLKEHHDEEGNDKRPEEAHERKEIERRRKEVTVSEEKEKRVKEALEQEEKDMRQPEFHDWEGNGKKLEAAQDAYTGKVEKKNLNTMTELYKNDENERKMKASGETCIVGEDNILTTCEAHKQVEENNKLKVAQEPCEHKEDGKANRIAEHAFEQKEIEKELKEAKVAIEPGKIDNSEVVHRVQSAPEQKVFEDKNKADSKFEFDYNEKKLQEAKEAAEQEKDEKNKKAEEISFDGEDTKKTCKAAQGVRQEDENGKKMHASQLAHKLEEKGDRSNIAKDINVSQNIVMESDFNEIPKMFDRVKDERTEREKEQEKERLRKLEEDREREREREKDRMAVERVTREARERAFAEARERAERAAVERATAEARQRAMAEARERLEKASVEARLRAERAAVERATAEAQERAMEKAMAGKAALAAKERVERSVSEKFSTTSRDSGMRQSASSSDLRDSQFQSSGSFNGSQRHPDSSSHAFATEKSQGAEAESAQRCKARLERHQRTVQRAAKALAEKNMRDLLAQREQAERNRLAETLDADVKRWSSGKEGNLRALLSTLQYILGPESGWQPIPLTEVITAVAVKKAYRKATLCVHPDKLQQRGASIQQKYVCEKVFDLLKEAWNKFNSEER